jgi:hypothetical protein
MEGDVASAVVTHVSVKSHATLSLVLRIVAVLFLVSIPFWVYGAYLRGWSPILLAGAIAMLAHSLLIWGVAQRMAALRAPNSA